MSINDRIKLISEELFNGNTSAMARTTGIKQSTLRDIIGERQSSPSYDTIRGIVDSASLNISTEWLLRGIGEMYAPSLQIQVLNHPKSIEKIIENQDIPLYDINAAANLKTLLGDKSQNIIGRISIPNMPRCDGAMYVRGDSMYPLLKSGDIIIYKEVHNFDCAIFGEMYLVSFGLDNDEYLTVKYVNPSEKKGYITLTSHNAYHHPMNIPVDGIYAMALIKASIRLNTMG